MGRDRGDERRRDGQRFLDAFALTPDLLRLGCPTEARTDAGARDERRRTLVGQAVEPRVERFDHAVARSELDDVRRVGSRGAELLGQTTDARLRWLRVLLR